MEDWLDPCLDAEEMRATDGWAIKDRGVPSLELMEAAGALGRRGGGAGRHLQPRGDRLRKGQQRRRRAGRGTRAA